jgi:hypothetical protein
MAKKGVVFYEAITITVVGAMIVVGLLGFFMGGTKYAKWLGFGNGDQKTKQTSVTKTESKPIIVKGEDGKTYFLQSTKTETSTLLTNEEIKLSLWERLKMLPRLWIILMLLGFIFPPISAIMAILNRNLMAKAKQIVSGVEDSLKKLDTQPEAKQAVLDTLSKKYDNSTKLFVSKVKNKA